MFVILCGKTASGKDTISKYLQENYDFIPIIPITDRPMRDGETEGVEYYFKTPSEFSKLINSNEFIEYREYKTKIKNNPAIFRYGTPKFDLEHGKDYVAISVLSAAEILKEYGGVEAVVYYLDTPDEVREARCNRRGDFDKDEWDRRLKADTIDFTDDKVNAVCDYTLYSNDNIKTKDLADLIIADCINRQECLDSIIEEMIR